MTERKPTEREAHVQLIHAADACLRRMGMPRPGGSRYALSLALTASYESLPSNETEGTELDPRYVVVNAALFAYREALLRLRAMHAALQADGIDAVHDYETAGVRLRQARAALHAVLLDDAPDRPVFMGPGPKQPPRGTSVRDARVAARMSLRELVQRVPLLEERARAAPGGIDGLVYLGEIEREVRVFEREVAEAIGKVLVLR